MTGVVVSLLSPYAGVSIGDWCLFLMAAAAAQKQINMRYVK